MKLCLVTIPVVIIATLTLSSCGLLFKREISDSEADKAIDQQLQTLSSQFVITNHQLKIEPSDDSDVVNGTITGHMIAETFTLDRVVTLPDGRNISLIRHAKDPADTITVPVTATFVPNNGGGWDLLAQPTFGVSFQALGQPLSAYPTGLDIKSKNGEKLYELSKRYDADISEQENLSEKATEISQLYAKVNSDNGNSNFQQIDFYPGAPNSNNWLLLRKYYPEYWESHNLGHVFDPFPRAMDGGNLLTYDEFHKLVDPIFNDTVLKDIADCKQRMDVLRNEIVSIQAQFRSY